MLAEPINFLDQLSKRRPAHYGDGATGLPTQYTQVEVPQVLSWRGDELPSLVEVRAVWYDILNSLGTSTDGQYLHSQLETATPIKVAYSSKPVIPGATAIVITLGFTNALACFRVRDNAAILQAVEAGLVEYLHIGCGLIVVCEVNAPLEFEFLKLDGAGE